jgi:hypothetical protein
MKSPLSASFWDAHPARIQISVNSDFAAVGPAGTGAIPRFTFGNHGPTEPGYPETGTVCRYKSTFAASRRLAWRMTFGCCASLLICSLFGW